jgi:beta-galactosidase
VCRTQKSGWATLAEEIFPTAAVVLGEFAGGRLDGRAAFTRNDVGAGRAYYLATIPDAAGAGTITAHLLAEAGVEPVLPGLPGSVEVARRGDVVTVINHGDTAVDLVLPGTDLQLGAAAGAVTLAPFDVRLLHLP